MSATTSGIAMYTTKRQPKNKRSLKGSIRVVVTLSELVLLVLVCSSAAGCQSVLTTAVRGAVTRSAITNTARGAFTRSAVTATARRAFTGSAVRGSAAVGAATSSVDTGLFRIGSTMVVGTRLAPNTLGRVALNGSSYGSVEMQGSKAVIFDKQGKILGWSQPKNGRILHYDPTG